MPDRNPIDRNGDGCPGLSATVEMKRTCEAVFILRTRCMGVSTENAIRRWWFA